MSYICYVKLKHYKIMNNAQEFFLDISINKSGEILRNMALPIMMVMIKFGKVMSQEAQEEAIECKLLGKELEANAIAKDITTITKNLTSLTNAYKIVMN